MTFHELENDISSRVDQLETWRADSWITAFTYIDSAAHWALLILLALLLKCSIPVPHVPLIILINKNHLGSEWMFKLMICGFSLQTKKS